MISTRAARQIRAGIMAARNLEALGIWDAKLTIRAAKRELRNMSKRDMDKWRVWGREQADQRGRAEFERKRRDSARYLRQRKYS